MLVLRGIAGHVLVNSLVANEAAKPAVEAVWSIATSLLATVAASALAFGILVFLAAWLAGPTGVATALRREAARPTSATSRSPPAGAAFLVWLALIAWAPIAAFRKPLGDPRLRLSSSPPAPSCCAARSAREFPDAPAGDVGERLRARLAARPRRAPPRPPSAAAAGAAEVDQLERLGALHRGGDLTDAQFEAAKAQVLGGPTASA